ncbi:MAG: FAD-dependent oxidoreductase [Kiritimatiellae bacterium]|nr:FAD-dependent oxidoreductase [Kiritimatiellia bacterium]
MKNNENHSIQYAESFLREGKNDEAIDLLRTPGPPSDGCICALLAKAYYQRGDARGDMYACHYFADRALELGFNKKWIYTIKAISAFRKERYGEAAETFSKYVTAESLPANQYLYGLALLYNHQPNQAIEWIDRALNIQPNNKLFIEAKEKAQKEVQEKGGKAECKKKEYQLGGFNDKRQAGVPTSYRFNAVSILKGYAHQPKDFDWLEKNIPCQQGCPAKTDIPGYLSAIYKGQYDLAYRINLKDNVFPAVLGRVCSRPCEDMCRHGWEGLGDSVAICFSKRSAADLTDKDPVVMDPWYPPTDKKVAVVGSGVAGLAAARNLALMGHSVTLYEKHNKPGGMMNQGIPKFRLPWETTDREVQQIQGLGIDIICNTEIGKNISLQHLIDKHDALVMAAGTFRPNILDLPGKELKGIRHGLDFLLESNETDHATIGEHVVVIGGGFTAMDCARTAKRLGAKMIHIESKKDEEVVPGSILYAKKDSVSVSYRRSVNEMLVTPGELDELKHEGIPMEFMVSPKAYIGEDGHVKAMQFIRTELGEPDASGRRRPVDVPGSEFEVPADTVLLATGQFPDTAWIDDCLKPDLVDTDQWLKSGKLQKTAHHKIFIAGDFATGALTLIDAIAHAKDAAREVDTFLMGKQRMIDVAIVEDAEATGRIREMDEVPRQEMPARPLEQRDLTGEVETGYDQTRAIDETQRCYFCHYKYEIDTDKCIYCDWCIKAKPRPNCIIKVRSLDYDDKNRIVGWQEAKTSEDTNMIWINQEDCIRCNACVEACPVDCISLQKVSFDVVSDDAQKVQNA